jgi:hypothetical protein
MDRPKKWTLRRTIGVLLFVSGLLWLAAGVFLHFLL